MPAKILIVDDHPIAQKGIASIVDSNPCYEVCGVLGRAIDVIPYINTQIPDVILLDLNLPDTSGINILAELIGAYDMTVVILTGEVNYKNIRLCLNMGVHGIVSKGDKGQDIINSLDGAMCGNIYLSQEVKNKVGKSPPDQIELSPRQMAILHFMSDGVTNKEICYRLKIAAPTVSFHIREIRKKLDVSHNKKILARAIDLGMI